MYYISASYSTGLLVYNLFGYQDFIWVLKVIDASQVLIFCGVIFLILRIQYFNEWRIYFAAWTLRCIKWLESDLSLYVGFFNFSSNVSFTKAAQEWKLKKCEELLVVSERLLSWRNLLAKLSICKTKYHPQIY